MVGLKRAKHWSDKFHIPCLPGIEFCFGIFKERKADEKFLVELHIEKSTLDYVAVDLNLFIESGNLTKNYKATLQQRNGFRGEFCLGGVNQIFDYIDDDKLGLKISGFLTYCIDPIFVSTDFLVFSHFNYFPL